VLCTWCAYLWYLFVNMLKYRLQIWQNSNIMMLFLKIKLWNLLSIQLKHWFDLAHAIFLYAKKKLDYHVVLVCPPVTFCDVTSLKGANTWNHVYPWPWGVWVYLLPIMYVPFHMCLYVCLPMVLLSKVFEFVLISVTYDLDSFNFIYTIFFI